MHNYAYMYTLLFKYYNANSITPNIRVGQTVNANRLFHQTIITTSCCSNKTDCLTR